MENQHNTNNHTPPHTDQGNASVTQPPGGSDRGAINNTARYQPTEPDGGGNLGAIIGAVIVIAVLVGGAFYFWGEKLMSGDEQTSALPSEEELAQPDAATQELQNVGDSTDVDAIEADLDATNLENLDAELGDIEAELGI